MVSDFDDKEIINKQLIQLSRQTAYTSKIGRRREQFCLELINHKKNMITHINNLQIRKAESDGEQITCKRGCSYSSCCLEYVDSTLGECEAIVYYLYKHESSLKLFLKNYTNWLRKTNELTLVMMTLEKRSYNFINHSGEHLINDESVKYFDKHNMCPFLDNNICTIYEVRPYSCVGYYVTAPLEQCAPDSSIVVMVKKHLPTDDVLDTRFYYHALNRPILLCMQKAVFGILEKGYFYLCDIPGLTDIEKEAISDKKVRMKYKNILRQFKLLS